MVALTSLALAFEFLSLPADAATPKPDLKRLYEISASGRFQNPVIVIHGAFGSRIRTTADHREIWPGTTGDLLFSSYEELTQDIDPHSLKPVLGKTEAYALFDKVGGHDYYGKIIKVLHDAGGYAQGRPGVAQTKAKPVYYVFIYDWRQDIARNAAKLDAFIDEVRRDYKIPGLRVDIVAHSMGALLTRYFIRYGSQDVLDLNSFQPNFNGAGKVRKVVLIGAPNLGSVSGLQYFLTGYRLGLGSIPTEAFATMPASYQLLPHPDRNWMITPEGRKADVKLYDVRTWRRFKWSIFDPDTRERSIFMRLFPHPSRIHQFTTSSSAETVN